MDENKHKKETNLKSQTKSMRLSSEVISHIESIAERENRSFSNTVETILKDSMHETLQSMELGS